MLHPLDKLHLYDEFENAKVAGGRIEFVWLIGIIGAFVLLLACINFMNLSTARSEKRSKEVGIRKTVGSVRMQLISQFLSESVVVALLAFIFSLILSQLSLSFFNNLADKQISIPCHRWPGPRRHRATSRRILEDDDHERPRAASLAVRLIVPPLRCRRGHVARVGDRAVSASGQPQMLAPAAPAAAAT